ncbi:transglutaminase family protein [Coraliomargarita algicola]|uniref:Transglutaminase family protein n=1 Tax=Coraliomargarita algicola TaxID=3092156 RepID=A0ABZ0RFQ1_9BACT|nr:transglutaminase family protein [Coraliomargarita sp. J2-16]WPJ94338.1 transglutaminase family protein [Coraliomargarita sp. J2-16]
MKFSVQHITRYTYAKPVWDSFNDAHLCPVSDDLQHCESFELKIAPNRPSVMRRLDFYTNQVHHFEVMEPHDYLEVQARSVVVTSSDTRDFTVTSEVSRLFGLDRNERYYDFLAGSQRVFLCPMFEHEAKEIVTGLPDVRLQVEAIMSYIFSHFSYAPGSTSVESNVMQVFEHKRGVCQDFAHVMIALCRSIGIPARYVSGYFYVEKSESGSASDNSASHAWVECFLPGIGWAGYDPTHDRRVDATYIKVAIGRDYVDVRPLAGTFRGGAVAEMEVAVQVERL